MAHYDVLHVMVPNAGVTGISPIVDMDFSEWRRVLSVNLDGVFLNIKHSAPAIVAAGGGTIVTISSTAGCALIGHYAASKAAVRSLTQIAAVELGPRGVRIKRAPARLRTPDEVAAAAVYFASEHATRTVTRPAARSMRRRARSHLTIAPGYFRKVHLLAAHFAASR